MADGRGLTPENLFAALLGLGLQWRVTACVFHKDQSQVDLQIEHTGEVGKRERCPRCGSEAKGYDRNRAVALATSQRDAISL